MSIATVVFLIVLSIRIGTALTRRAQGTAPPGPKRRTIEDHRGVIGASWLLCGGAFIIALFNLSGTTTPVRALVLTVSTLLLFPWWFARGLAIPLGLPRTAAVLAFVASWTWGRDRGGAASLAAVLAIAAQRRSQASRLGRLWQRLAHRPVTDLLWVRARVQGVDLLGGAGVVATAMLADLDDTAAQGDALAATLSSFDPRVVPPTARRLAAERRVWRLFAGADDDVDSAVVERLTARRSAVLAVDAAGSPTVRLLQALLILDSAPEDFVARSAVRWWWLLAPRRRQTLALLRRRPPGWPLPAVPTPAPAADIQPDVDCSVDSSVDSGHSDRHDDENILVLALRLHAEARRRAPSLQQTIDVAAAWAVTLPPTAEAARRRARELRLNDDAVAADLEHTVQQALIAMAEPLDFAGVAATTLPEPLVQALATIRSNRLDALEIANAAWRVRVEGAVDLAPVDELREWVALLALVEAVARTGVDGRYVAYETIQWCVCERAVRLWNIRCEHRLANAMFRWLLNEAERVADTRGVETQLANVKCGP